MLNLSIIFYVLLLPSDLEYEAIIGVVETIGKLFFLDGMKAEVVAHVDEVCRYGTEVAAKGDGLLYGLMCLVRCVAQSPDDKQADTLEQWQRGIKKSGNVSEVGHITDAITQDGQLAVHDAQGCDRKRTKLQEVPLLYLMQFQFRNAWIAVPYQTIREPLPQVFASIVVGIEGQVSVEGKWAEIVNATYVVVVFMGDENGIQRIPHPDAQHLFAEVGAAIQQKPCISLFEKCRSTQAAVARIATGAYFASASYLWYADACACSEESDFHLLFDDLLFTIHFS